MKSFAAVIALFFVTFVLSSCSDVNQDYSPVSPKINKVSVSEYDGAFQYLQTFEEIPVVSFSSPSVGQQGNLGLIINCESKYWPSNVLSVFVVLAHYNIFDPAFDELVVINNPESNVLSIPNASDKNLKSVRVFYFVEDIGIVPQGLPDYSSLEKLHINSWNTSGKSIEVYSNDWKSSTSNCFLELQMKDKNILVYISKPEYKQFTVPKFGDKSITDIKLFGLDLQYQQ